VECAFRAAGPGLSQPPSPLTAPLELAAILCHVEQRVIGNDYTFSFAGRPYQIARQDAQTGMRHQRLRVELRLNSELKARYQGRYVNIAECAAQVASPPPAIGKPAATITMREGRAAGCRDSSIALAHRCGKPSGSNPFCAPDWRPAIFALYGPKPPLGSSTSSNGYSLRKGPLRRPVETTRMLLAVGGPAPIAPRSQLRRLGFPRRDPGQAVRTYHEGF